MMVKWADDGLLQANASKMRVSDSEMLVNDGEMNIYIIYTLDAIENSLG